MAPQDLGTAKYYNSDVLWCMMLRYAVCVIGMRIEIQPTCTHTRSVPARPTHSTAAVRTIIKKRGIHAEILGV